MGKEMRVIWLVNILFPDVCEALKMPSPVIGGWMYSSAKMLMQHHDGIRLYVVAAYDGGSLKRLERNGITYYLVPGKNKEKKYDASAEKYYKEVYEEVKPDVVHIHGTEFPHSLEFVNACGKEKTVVSIQGLVSVYARYFYGGMKLRELLSTTSLRDVLKGDTYFAGYKSMKQRGVFEAELIKHIDHVMGRTFWDYANCKALNPEISYHKCGEILRSSFYEYSWDYGKCRKHSIFVSQGILPLKGLHQVLKAMPVILRKFPDTEIYVAGPDILNKAFYKHLSYGNYLNRLINKYGLKGKVHFLGYQNEAGMREHYLEANVFVCPSSIENSPNSLGEAQILGMPCVASYVGGTMEFIEDGKSGFLYRFEETDMLAMRICRIFESRELAETLSAGGRAAASERHDRARIAGELAAIYEKVAKGKDGEEQVG